MWIKVTGVKNIQNFKVRLLDKSSMKLLKLPLD